MDIMENVKNIVSDTAQVVAEKSGELIEKSKIQYSIFGLNNDIKKLYAEIGKLSYGLFEKDEDNSDDIKMKCEILTAKLAKLEMLKRHPEAAEFKCPVCGRRTDGAENYCPSCGSDMTASANSEGSNEE